ncbi:unnamed protein product [Toxocara canis]|uniref:RICTOR_V domain-containing protein n=1 Tax=Toxocara canis TaxID=6265 RepID=A0A183V6J1_TOXCA|nr:unnamed protein product [Toxocara canis]
MTERFLTKLKLVGAIGTKESTNAYHDFAWCLDACVRDKNLDAQQTSKLKNILELAKKSPPELVSEMAMVAADAHVVHFLSSMSVKVLKDTAVHCSGHLPRELPSLHLLFRLLTLGASAHHIVNTKDASAAQTMACRDPRAHLITHRVVQPAPFDNPLSNEEAANCFINEYMMNGLDIRAGIKCHLLRIVNLLGAVIGEQRVRLIMDRIPP